MSVVSVKMAIFIQIFDMAGNIDMGLTHRHQLQFDNEYNIRFENISFHISWLKNIAVFKF